MASASQFTAACALPMAAGTACSVASISCSGSVDGLPHGPPVGHKRSGAGNGGASTVTVTVVQCINSGIDSDAASTIAHAVMCRCGLRTRNRFKPIHTTPPRSRERSADSARIASIISSLPSLSP